MTKTSVCLLLLGLSFGSTLCQSGEKEGVPRGQGGSEMVLIPAGEFWMGTEDGKPSGGFAGQEYPRHKVWVDAFYMDKNSVSNRQFQDFVGATGYVTEAEKSRGGNVIVFAKKQVETGKVEISVDVKQVRTAIWKDPQGDGKGIHDKMSNPVVQVSWNDAQAYCKWAGKRLPTEAEWEKAARGGTETDFFWGDAEETLGDFAWYAMNSDGRTHPVGQKKPNPFGLYDILGNVNEWCWDRFGLYEVSSGTMKNPQGPESNVMRVQRGGSWSDIGFDLRCASRSGLEPNSCNDELGFRCARTSSERGQTIAPVFR